MARDFLITAIWLYFVIVLVLGVAGLLSGRDWRDW